MSTPDELGPAVEREERRRQSLRVLAEVADLGDVCEFVRAARRHVVHFPETDTIAVPKALFRRLLTHTQNLNPRARTVQLVGERLSIQKTRIVESPDG